MTATTVTPRPADPPRDHAPSERVPAGPSDPSGPSGPSGPARPAAATRFELPADRIAPAPVEASGRARDAVRMLVARPGGIQDRWFRDLPGLLDSGDVVVVNTSAAVPAALDGHRADGRATVVHLAGPAPDAGPRGRLGEVWVVELRRPDRRGPQLDGREEEIVRTTSGARITLLRPRVAGRGRLWLAAVATDGEVVVHLQRHGRPIAYGYLAGEPTHADHRTVFGVEPGSAEMASAGRPFRHRTVTELVTRGVLVVPVTLHAGVSSLEADEPPPPERFTVPAVTAAVVTAARRRGSRIVAVGTTVTRALETVVAPDGDLRPGHGWTELVLGPDRPARVVDGLLTGWHAPEASHLALLEAVAGADLVGRAYAAALAGEHRWHEFGDTCLLLPGG